MTLEQRQRLEQMAQLMWADGAVLRTALAELDAVRAERDQLAANLEMIRGAAAHVGASQTVHEICDRIIRQHDELMTHRDQAKALRLAEQHIRTYSVCHCRATHQACEACLSRDVVLAMLCWPRYGKVQVLDCPTIRPDSAR